MERPRKPSEPAPKDLSPADRARQTAHRKTLYERLHPESRLMPQSLAAPCSVVRIFPAAAGSLLKQAGPARVNAGPRAEPVEGWRARRREHPRQVAASTLCDARHASADAPRAGRDEIRAACDIGEPGRDDRYTPA